MILDRVCAVHVFSWWPARERLPLAERDDLWQRVTEEIASRGQRFDLLMEFVPDDAVGQVLRDARVLRTIADRAVIGAS